MNDAMRMFAAVSRLSDVLALNRMAPGLLPLALAEKMPAVIGGLTIEQLRQMRAAFEARQRQSYVAF